MLITVLLSILSYLFFTIIFYGLGSLISNLLLFKINTPIVFAFKIALGVLLTAFLTTLSVSFGLENDSIQILMICIFVFSIGSFFCNFDLRNISLKILLACIAYFTLGAVYVNFPNGELGSASALQTMKLGRLQADNFIPYNFSRYIIERTDPNSIEVVPQWRASERPPLMAIVNSAFFLAFATQEEGEWMKTSPLPFGLFQLLGLYLNLLSMLGVACVAQHFYGKSASLYSLSFIGSTYFYFLNTWFTWPKFMMAYFLLLGVVISESKLLRPTQSYFFGGLLFGAGLISHEMGMFVVASFLFYKLILLFLDISKIWEWLKSTSILLAGTICIYLPWLLYKYLYLDKPLRGVAYHLFCSKKTGYETSLSILSNQFFQANSFSDHILRIWGNILLPFSFPGLSGFWSDPLRVLNHLQTESFLHFISSLGWLSLPLFFLGLYRSKLREEHKVVGILIFTSIGSFLLAALTTGCTQALVNHVWCYFAFLVFGVVVSRCLVAAPIGIHILYGVLIGTNMLLAVYFLFYQTGMSSVLHSGTAYKCSLLTLMFLFQGICLLGHKTKVSA